MGVLVIAAMKRTGLVTQEPTQAVVTDHAAQDFTARRALVWNMGVKAQS